MSFHGAYQAKTYTLTFAFPVLVGEQCCPELTSLACTSHLILPYALHSLFFNFGTYASSMIFITDMCAPKRNRKQGTNDLSFLSFRKSS